MTGTLTAVTVAPQGHQWRIYIAPWLLEDEPARRAFVAHVRWRAAEEGYRGRVRFRRAHSDMPRAFIENTPPDTYWIEVHPVTPPKDPLMRQSAPTSPDQQETPEWDGTAPPEPASPPSPSSAPSSGSPSEGPSGSSSGPSSEPQQPSGDLPGVTP